MDAPLLLVVGNFAFFAAGVIAASPGTQWSIVPILVGACFCHLLSVMRLRG